MEPQDTSGFYRIDPDGGELQYAPNFVYAPTYTLLRADHATYTYPVDGWYWFDTLKQAEAFFETTDDEIDQLVIDLLA
jgi:hypothetical protein